MAKKDAIATTQETAVAIPEFLAEFKGVGLEHLKQSDLQVPRVTLAYGTSPQMQEDDPAFIEELKIGEAFNKVTGQIYGKGPWDIAFVRADPPKWIEFFPREQGGGIKEANVQADDPRTEFHGDKKPEATQFYEYVIIFLETKEMILLSLSKSGIKIAKHLNTLMYFREKENPGLPVFMGKYTMRSVPTKGPKGPYPVFQFRNAGFNEDPDLLKFLAATYTAVKDKEIITDREEVTREPGEDDDVDDGAGAPEGSPTEM